MLFAGLRSVRMVKNCDLGLKNAALGLRLNLVGRDAQNKQPLPEALLECARVLEVKGRHHFFTS